MARHDPIASEAGPAGLETRASIDALIGPGLRYAFPLPATDNTDDERFQLLLDALAKVTLNGGRGT